MRDFSDKEIIYEGRDVLVYRVKSDNQSLIIKQSKTEHPSHNAKLDYENNLYQRVDSPFVIKSKGTEDVDGKRCIVFDDDQSESLKNVMESRKVSLEEQLQIFHDVACGLRDLHKVHIIHKDVNPANIIVNNNNQTYRLIDLGISTQLSRETPSVSSLNKLEGTLNYLSPEQTGRINRSMDFRTDFFSLGVTMYETLCGENPFKSNDAMATVHRIIATVPPSVNTVQPNVPKALSDLVDKLIAKSPEERYQSPEGLIEDIKFILDNLGKPSLANFTVGGSDHNSSFAISDKIYGREAEIETLRANLELAKKGQQSLVLVKGPSGIGKSALVSELAPHIFQANALYGKGKFDQFGRAKPYSAFIDSLSMAIRSTFSSGTGLADEISRELCSELSRDEQLLLVNILPFARNFIQDVDSEAQKNIDPSKMRSQSKKCLFTFCQALSKAHNALVLFIDDFQWCDSESLELLENLMSQDSKGMMIIVAYRDNEVTDAHPFAVSVAKLRDENRPIHDILVKPLPNASLTELIQDSFETDAKSANELASLVHAKTGNNPFFVRTFLKDCYDKELIQYSFDAKQWQIDLAGIGAEKTADNVVDLLISKLHNLPEATTSLLTSASCSTNNFDLYTLAAVSGSTPSEVLKDLWVALKQDIIVPLSIDYKNASDAESAKSAKFAFAHDRVYEATHALLDDSAREQVHINFAKTLHTRNQSEKNQRFKFEIADHFAHGRSLLTAELAPTALQYNIEAGLASQGSGAFEPAIHYFENAIRLIESYKIERSTYDFVSLYHSLAKSYLVVKRFDDVKNTIDLLLRDVEEPLARASVYQTLGLSYKEQGDLRQAINASFEGLNTLKFRLPRKGGFLSMGLQIGLLYLMVTDKFLKWYENAEREDDERWTLILALMTQLLPDVYLVDQKHWAVVGIAFWRRAYKERRTVHNPLLGSILGILLLVIKDARAVKRVMHKSWSLRDTVPKSESGAMFHIVAGHWGDTVYKKQRDTSNDLETGFRYALDLGTISDGTTCAGVSIINGTFGGFTLPELESRLDRYLPVFKNAMEDYSFPYWASPYYLVKFLRGSSKDYQDDFLSEEVIEEKCRNSAEFAISVFKINRAIVHFTAERYWQTIKECLTNLVELKLGGSPYIAYHYCILIVSIYRFLATKSIFYPKFAFKGLATYSFFVLNWWRKHSSFYAIGFYEFALAEKYSYAGKHAKAAKTYELALQKFKDSSNYMWIAYTHEALAKTYQNLSLAIPAQTHLEEAHQAYQKFDSPLLTSVFAERTGFKAATVKRNDHGTITSGTTTGSTDSMDVLTIVKATREISSQMNITGLLDNMLRIMMENAGATRGAFIVKDDADWTINRTGVITKDGYASTELHSELDSSKDVPISMVRSSIQLKSHQTFETIAEAQESFPGDHYLSATTSKSLLVYPIISGQDVKAIVLLENDLVEGSFTDSHLEVLKVLSAQSGISLQNATQVQEIEERSAKIHDLKGQLEKILDGTKQIASCQKKDKAVGFAFSAMVNEIDAFSNSRCSVLLFSSNDTEKAVYLPILKDGRVDKSSTYDAADQLQKWGSLNEGSGVKAVGGNSLVSVIQWQEERLGLLILEDVDVDTVNDEQKQFVETLTQSLALGLRNIEYQEHLEDLVAERTAALEKALKEVTEKQAKIQAIMDNIKQGILTISVEGTVEPEFSNYLTSLLKVDSNEITDAQISKVLFEKSDLSSDQLSRVREVLKATLGEDDLSWEINSSNLPRELRANFGSGERIIELDWNPIMTEGDDIVARIMLVLRDVTDTRRLEEQVKTADEAQQRKMAVLSAMLKIDRTQLGILVDDAVARVAELIEFAAAKSQDHESVFRNLHTLKGTFNTVGLMTVTTLAHEAEDLIPSARNELKQVDWDTFQDRLELLASEIDYHRSVFDEVFGDHASAEAWSLYNFSGQIIKKAKESAAGHGLEFGDITITDGVGEWTAEHQTALLGILPHCINNALDHGYVLPAKKGQSVRPLSLSLQSKVVGQQIEVTVSDRGVGIDHAKIQDLAKAKGISESEYLEVLFESGSSTAETVTETSGRGVGLGTIRDFSRKAGGDVELSDHAGGGTSIRITLPVANAKGSRTAA